MQPWGPWGALWRTPSPLTLPCPPPPPPKIPTQWRGAVDDYAQTAGELADNLREMAAFLSETAAFSSGFE